MVFTANTTPSDLPVTMASAEWHVASAPAVALVKLQNLVLFLYKSRPLTAAAGQLSGHKVGAQKR